MIELGSLLFAIAVTAVILGLGRPSTVVRRLDRLARTATAGGYAHWRPGGATTGSAFGGLIPVRAAAALATAALAFGAGLPLLIPALGYATYIAPAVVADRRRGRELRSAERGLGAAIEWVDALVSIGQPAERAVAAAARQGTGAVRLDRVLRDASAAAALGAPLFRVLAAEARGAGFTQLAELATELDRTRDLGRGSRSVIRDAREALRRQERARAIASAAKVETKLMLVLVGCYLPALMLLVVVPLFVGLLGGLVE